MTKRQRLAQEIFKILGGLDALEKIGARRIESHDEGIIFLIERDGITLAAVTIGKREDGFTLYFKRLPPPGGATSYKGLGAEELRTALAALLKHYAPEEV